MDATSRRTVLDMTGYQWTVLFAAWLGWGFDVFDGLLFNYVAPNCVPTLLGLQIGTPEASAATLRWTGITTSLLLVGWAIGGVGFARVADRLGRARTLLLTMAIYSLGTAACAAAPNIWVLLLFRFVASLGIGGEWAAGAAMVAEVVPEKRRVEAGALLYTSAPLGLFLATFVTYQVQGVLFKGSPETAWRWVFLCGLLPAAVAMAVRMFIREPERWVQVGAAVPRMAEIFGPNLRRRTFSGLAMALVALLTWWSCNAFISIVAKGLAVAAGDKTLGESFVRTATNMFNLGGLLGTLATVPIAKALGRRTMFGLYFALASAAIYAAFGLDWPPEQRLYLYFPIGLTVFGVFGSFTYYLPELYPTRLRGTGAGFCYNAGRVITAAGPVLVGTIAARGADALGSALAVLTWVAAVPAVGLLLLPLVVETRGQVLED
jgi:MFS family permease